jgi:hypothetical protein
MLHPDQTPTWHMTIYHLPQNESLPIESHVHSTTDVSEDFEVQQGHLDLPQLLETWLHEQLLANSPGSLHLSTSEPLLLPACHSKCYSPRSEKPW